MEICPAFPGGPMKCLSLLLAFDQSGVSIYFFAFPPIALSSFASNKK
jgi:hypothetical protein